MSNNNFLDILKTISEAMKCPSCGNAYKIEEIQFVSQIDDYSLVHLSCSSCKVPVWINFFTTDKKPSLRQDPYMLDEFDDLEEITSDEQISFHKMIKRFDGDFKRAFTR